MAKGYSWWGNAVTVINKAGLTNDAGTFPTGNGWGELVMLAHGFTEVLFEFVVTCSGTTNALDINLYPSLANGAGALLPDAVLEINNLAAGKHTNQYAAVASAKRYFWFVDQLFAPYFYMKALSAGATDTWTVVCTAYRIRESENPSVKAPALVN